jgi:sulfide:quinone oxidoreductase
MDKDGWVKVNQNSLETSYKGVYAVGDAAAIKLPVIGVNAPKAGIFAHYQAEVVARNIALLAQEKETKYKYTGKGA